SIADLEKAFFDEDVEVVPGDIGMNFEELGHRRSRQRLDRFPDGDVYGASCGIVQGRGVFRDPPIERFVVHCCSGVGGHPNYSSDFASTPFEQRVEVMSTQEELFQAVASIGSPVFVGRTMGELGLVRSVTKKITGKVKVDLILPIPHQPEILDPLLQK